MPSKLVDADCKNVLVLSNFFTENFRIQTSTSRITRIYLSWFSNLQIAYD